MGWRSSGRRSPTGRSRTGSPAAKRPGRGRTWASARGQINEWGLPTFRRESQHEVEGADGLFFDANAFAYCEPGDLPADMSLVRGWDLGATQAGGDPSVGALLGNVKGSPKVYVLDVKRERYATNDVRLLAARCAEADAEGIVYDEDEKDGRGAFLRAGEPLYVLPPIHGSAKQRFPQDPGAAGKSQADDFKADLGGYLVKTAPVRRKKSIRHRKWQDRINVGNVILVRAGWNKAFVEEHRLYREDEEHEHDDQADAASDADREFFPDAVKSAPKNAPPVSPLLHRPLGRRNS